ncbi:uroporphyrinogen decarboxylase family protein [Candidatus Alkanophaga liquidiphilum]|nr:Uroporphyrinogen-III decarboxylase HemE [Candidatus Alkanophaga liquidiphilum]RLG37389.1 MAG: hypothetical protein DRN91_05585 [Candidatus Alkanophagales archaeon]
MNAYERVMAVLEGRKDEVDRLPCVNTVSTATREFMEATDAFFPDAHKDVEKMVRLGAAAHKLCGLDNVSIPFDMTIEAEVFGAPIDFKERAAKKGRFLWPMSKRFIIDDPSMFFVPDGFPRLKRVAVVEEAIKKLKEEFGSKVPVNVFMVPPFTSLSSYLVDTVKFMMWTRTEPQKIHEFMKVATPRFIEIAKVYEEAGADIITFHEMGGSMDNVSPDAWREFVGPYLKELIGAIKESKTVLNICGRTEFIIEDMVRVGADAIAFDERTKVSVAREKADSVKKGYPIIGNVPAKQVIHAGSGELIKKVVKKTIEDGIDIVSPGCDFWIETPVEKIKIFVSAVEEYGKRQ